MKKAILIIVLYVFMQIVLGYIFISVGMLTSNVTNLEEYMKTSSYFWVFGGSLLLADIAMVGITYMILNKHSFHPVAFYLKVPRMRDMALSVITFLPFIFLINGIGELIGSPSFLLDNYGGFSKNWLCLLCGIIVSPISEEFCFRGGILASLYASPKYRRYALVISSFGFGLLNLVPAQIVIGFLTGMFLGWIFLRTQSLMLPIICRVIYNIIAFSMIIGLGAQADMIELFPSPTIYYITLAGSAVLFFPLLWLTNKYLYRASIEEEL